MNDTSPIRGGSNTGMALIGLALGAALGAGVALLLAPDSGKGTRERLASAARRWRRDAGHTLDRARETVADLGTDAQSAVRAGHEAFKHDRTTRESRSERQAAHSSDLTPGTNAGKLPREGVAR